MCENNWYRPLIIISTILLLMFTTGFPTACRRGGRPSGDSVIKLFGKGDSISDTTISRTGLRACIAPRNAIEIYIDASGSMKGFLTPPSGTKSAYVDFINALAAYLASKCSEDDSYWYSFGTSTQRMFPDALDAIRYSKFYCEDSTQLGPLIQGFSGRSDSEIPKAIVIITDGIQSTPEGSDFTKVVRGVAQWLGRGFNFEILLFKSDFQGHVYSETGRNNGLYDLGEYKSTDYGPRPFYCYVFSVTSDWGKNLMTVLQSHSTFSCNLLNFPSVLFATSVPELEIPETISVNERNPLREYGSEKNVKFLYPTGKKERSLPGELIANITLRVQSGVPDFIFNPRNLHIQVECMEVDSNKKVDFPLVNLTDVFPDSIIHLSAGTFKVRHKYLFDDVGRVGWVAYHIMILPTDATFGPPNWIDEWSTSSDLSPSDFSKSLYFKEFITNIMMSTQFRKQCLADFHVTIKRR
jgi:hypothetical protein